MLRKQDGRVRLIARSERAGLDILTHGDFHVDEDLAGRAWHHDPPGTLLNEIYKGWRWPHVVDQIEHRPVDYAKLWRIAQGCNIVRREPGLEATRVPAADPMLQIDVVPGR